MTNTVTKITWNWGSNTSIEFDPTTDILDFGWFAATHFEISEVNGSVVISIPSNNQSYTLTGVSLADLSMGNITGQDASAMSAWQSALDSAGETGSGSDGGADGPDAGDDTGDGTDSGSGNDAGSGDDTGSGDNAGSGSDTGAGDPSDLSFSPYIDMSLSTSQDVVNIAADAGLNAITLAFVQTSGPDSIGWGGQGTIETATLYNGTPMSQVIADLQGMGVDVTISFGGAVGHEAATTFSSVDALVSAYQSVIDAYGVTKLDYDIEGSAITDLAGNALRNEALVRLQEANPGLEVSFTLPVLTNGLTAAGITLLESAADAGVDIAHVNIMAMDYGAYYDTGDMGDDAISAAEATLQQFDNIGLDTDLVITPMIGINDVTTEVFTLEDAGQLVEYVRSNERVTGISMWSLGRDNGSTVGVVSPVGSGIEQDTFDFSEIFNTVDDTDGQPGGDTGDGDTGDGDTGDGTGGGTGADNGHGGDTDIGDGTGGDDGATTTRITWNWGTDTELAFNPETDTLDFHWFSASDVDIAEEDGSVIISIPSNDQTYTLVDISLKDLSMDDISGKDASLLAEWQSVLEDAATSQAAVTPADDLTF